MSKGIVTFLNMSKGYRGVSKKNEGIAERHIRDIVATKGRNPFSTSNYFDLLNDLSKDSSIDLVNYVFMMSEDWMHSFCGGRNIGSIDISNNFKMHYSSSFAKLKKMLMQSSLVIIRGNYSEWNIALKNIKCNYIFLPCWARISPENIKLNLDPEKSTIWVDDIDIAKRFLGSEYTTDIFKKPAMSYFYSDLKNNKKEIDLCLVCSKTDRPHKRVDLFIDSLNYLDKLTKNKIKAIIIGDSSFHKDKISSLNLKMVSLTAAYDGKRTSKKKIIQILDSCKLSICASSIDANPRVIIESLARDVPVLCASDLGGGKFQINKKTGMIYDPNPEDLAKKIQLTLADLNRFSPRSNCIKISDAVNQILGLLVQN